MRFHVLCCNFAGIARYSSRSVRAARVDSVCRPPPIAEASDKAIAPSVRPNQEAAQIPSVKKLRMRNRKRQTEAALQASERRQREDEAPRLRHEVNRLTGLRLVIEEYHGEGTIAAVRHTRHIVIDHAPALFEIPCSEAGCKDGGHDLTLDIMGALRSAATEFEGEDTCYGQVGLGGCGRVLHFAAHATYR